MEDWIDRFLDYTDAIPSPPIFRLWSAIAAIGGSLERRCWLRTSPGDVFPNLFLLLVGGPATGKTQAIDHTEDLWRSTKKLSVSPKSITKAGMVDRLAGAQKNFVTKTGTMTQYHSLQVASTEFGNLVPKHDLEFLNVLNNIFDSPPVYDEGRRDEKRNVTIIKPQLTIIAGTQPSYLNDVMPEGAWSQGFMSRVIMVHSGKAIKIDLFRTQGLDQGIKHGLVRDMSAFCDLYGQFAIEDDARAELLRWYGEDMAPTPDHPKLYYYAGRRLVNWLKLMMIAAISRSGELRVTMEDLNRAREWLLQAEHTMPQVFKEMTGKGDSATLQEMHNVFWKIYCQKKEPIHESRLIEFLTRKVPDYKVISLLEIAKKMRLIQAVGPQSYVILPHMFHEE